MLRIAICDDELHAREALRLQLEKVIQEPKEQIVYEFSSGQGAAKWMKNHAGEIDLLFLDVEMKGMDGMQTAAEIRTFDKHIQIAFVTGFADYVFQGYQVNALDYIIKPVAGEKIKALIERVRGLLKQEKTAYYVLHNSDGTYRIPVSEICYFYSERRLVYVVTKEKEYPFYQKLNQVEQKLSQAFIRIHQRYLVNPACVSYMGRESVSINGKELPISRALKESAATKLAMYLMEG